MFSGSLYADEGHVPYNQITLPDLEKLETTTLDKTQKKAYKKALKDALLALKEKRDLDLKITGYDGSSFIAVLPIVYLVGFFDKITDIGFDKMTDIGPPFDQMKPSIQEFRTALNKQFLP